MAKTKTNTRIILGIAGTVAAGAAAFVALAYVRSGRRGQQSPLLPKKIEKQLDKMISWLDSRFGRAWVDRGMDALQSALQGTGPDNLVQLLEQAFKTHAGEQKDKPSGNGAGSRFSIYFGRN